MQKTGDGRSSGGAGRATGKLTLTAAQATVIGAVLTFLGGMVGYWSDIIISNQERQGEKDRAEIDATTQLELKKREIQHQMDLADKKFVADLILKTVEKGTTEEQIRALRAYAEINLIGEPFKSGLMSLPDERLPTVQPPAPRDRIDISDLEKQYTADFAFSVSEHRLLRNDSFVPMVMSPNVGAKFGDEDPRLLVFHFDASLGITSTIDHSAQAGSKASAHLQIGKHGEVAQTVPFDVSAWHAGVSRWNGLTGLNRHSIGINLENLGELSGGPGNWKTWFGRAVDDRLVMVAPHKSDRAPQETGWEIFPERQILAAVAVCRALIAAYPTVKDIVGHEDISPGRKRDPGPAFPMERVRRECLRS